MEARGGGCCVEEEMLHMLMDDMQEHRMFPFLTLYVIIIKNIRSL